MRLRRYNSPLPSPPPSTHSFNTILEYNRYRSLLLVTTSTAQMRISRRASRKNRRNRRERGGGGVGGKWKVSGLSQGEQTGWLDSRKVSLHAIGVTRSFEPEWRWSKQRRVKFLSDGSRGGSESGGRERVRERSLLDYAAPSSRLTSPPSPGFPGRKPSPSTRISLVLGFLPPSITLVFSSRLEIGSLFFFFSPRREREYT